MPATICAERSPCRVSGFVSGNAAGSSARVVRTSTTMSSHATGIFLCMSIPDHLTNLAACRVKLRTATVLLFLACLSANAESLAARSTLQRMQVAEGFEVSVVASEPEIRQPLSITFDERGRMWVIQYLQYPKPAGLKPVKVDQYLRTKYDRVPEPPPRGVKGADRITICDDTDGDGRADKFTDFVTGLNLCSGMVRGHGGVFVAQPPYLLFYADRNR